MADVCARVEDAVTVAGLCRALVAAAADGRLPRASGAAGRLELVRAGTWRAARYGLDGQLLHPVRGELVAAWELVDELSTRRWTTCPARAWTPSAAAARGHGCSATCTSAAVTSPPSSTRWPS